MIIKMGDRYGVRAFIVSPLPPACYIGHNSDIIYMYIYFKSSLPEI